MSDFAPFALIAHFEFSLSPQNMIHIANVLYLASYSVRDILWLRILTVIAALCLLPYYFQCSDHPLWEAIGWNVLFILVNLVQIFILVKERWPRKLVGVERELYDTIFHSLTPGEFVGLMKLGRFRDMAAGTTLVEDGTVVQEMMVLTEGAAEVRVGDRLIATLKPGQFVGEMSFITRNKASAAVVTAEGAKVLAWPQEELQEQLTKQGELAFKVQGVIGRDLVKKLEPERDAPLEPKTEGGA